MPLRHRVFIFVLVVLGALGPLVLYAVTLGRAPSVTPVEAQRILEGSGAVIVDVTSPALDVAMPHFLAIPLPVILELRGPQEMPAVLRDRTLLLLCPGGLQSAEAARHLQAIGVRNAFSVRGGWQEWIAAAPDCPAAVRFTRTPTADATIPMFRPATPLEQFAAVFTFFGLKFFYTLISGALIVILWRQRAPDLAALRWSMVAFFVGEACCFINVMVFFEDSMLLEHLHGVGMVLTFAFAIWAMLEFLDGRVVHVSDSARCGAVGLCLGCVKHRPGFCGSRRVFLLLIPATALLACVPLCASFRHNSYNTRIYGVLHNYSHNAVHQLYELRVLPVMALGVLGAAMVVLLWWERHPTPVTKILFAAAAGALGFSFFRMFLVAGFIDNLVWSDAWEETTELMYVGFVAAVLFIFRRALLVRG